MNKSVFLLLFTAVFSLLGCDPVSCPDSEIRDAERLIIARDYEGAIALLTPLMEEYAECGALHYQLGMANEWIPAPGPCITAYTRAATHVRDTCPDLVNALLGRAWCHTLNEDHANAVVDYRSALIMGNSCDKGRESEEFIRLSMANSYYELGRLSDAEEELTILLVTAEGNDRQQGLYNRGRVHLALEKPADALRDFRELQGPVFEKGGWKQWYIGLCHAELGAQDSACYSWKLAADAGHLQASGSLKTTCPEWVE